ncbi:MAG: putative sulfate exporter family transporter, partial [Bradyrhizobium sp.]
MTLPASPLVSNAGLATHAPHAANALRRSLFALGRPALTVLPGLLMASSVAASAYLVRRLPGMTTLSPLILAILIGTALHNLVGTPALAKPGIGFSLRRLLRFGIILLGFQLT